MSAQNQSSAPVYAAEIPPSVRPGDTFNVAIPNSDVKIPVRCPRGRGPGDRFNLHPFRVTLPDDIRKNRTFTTVLNGTQVNIKAPKKAKPGQVLTVYRAVFPQSNQEDLSKQNAWKRGKWADYLAKLREGVPEISEELIDKALTINPEDIPNEFICTITQEIMSDPVVAIDGNTYERQAIEQWFEKHATSPKTNEQLPSTILIPNRALRSQIADFLTNYNPAMDEMKLEEDSDYEADNDIPTTTTSTTVDHSVTSPSPAVSVRPRVKLVALRVVGEKGEIVSFDTNASIGLRQMAETVFTVKQGTRFEIFLSIKVLDSRADALKLFVITQKSRSDETAISEKDIGTFDPQDEPYDWSFVVDAPTGKSALGHYISDLQLMNGSGVLVDCSFQYNVKKKWD